MSDVKKWNLPRGTTISESPDGEFVLASDYAALEAELARLLAGQELVAYITGYHGGRCIIEPVNRAAVLPSGMALYATPQPCAVPAGWKLVPVEPTPEMIDAALQSSIAIDPRNIVIEDYKAMLAAAPSAPATVQGVNQQLLGALEGLVNVNEQHNAAIQRVTGTPAGWKDDYLNQARAAIAAARKGEGE